MTDFDSAWKEALDRYLGWFLAFFFPWIDQEIDWTRDYEALDQELRKLAPEGDRGRRHADKLVKLFTRQDEETYLHVEIQCQFVTDFARRVYVYNYRAEDRYNQPVVSVVVFGDDNPDWKPTEYVFEKWGCRKTFTFPAVKLLEYVGQEAALEANANPFALLVLTHLQTLATRDILAARRDWKIRLIKGLYQRRLDAEDVRQWYRYLDWLLELPAEWEAQVWQEIAQYEQERQMPYVTNAERIGMQKGLEKGLQQGLQQGLEQGLQQGLDQGRQQGRQESLLKGIELALDLKFGADGLALMPAIEQQTDLAVLEQVFSAIKPAQTPEDLRRLLPA